jgi:hypothetical protein
MISIKNTVHKKSKNKLNIQGLWLLLRTYGRLHAFVLGVN